MYDPLFSMRMLSDFDLIEEATEVCKITGYIPDTPFLYDLLTVTEFLRFTGDLYGLGRNGFVRETGELIEFSGWRITRAA